MAFGDVSGYLPASADALVEDAATGHWTGFFPEVPDGAAYRFWIVGQGASGFKRDPWARELESGVFDRPACIVRARDSYPWHDDGFVPPAFADLAVYQFHIGVFAAVDGAGGDLRPHRAATFLDALERVPYLVDLGVNAVQPLPFVEFRTPTGQGYNGTDLFSPETDYCVAPGALAPHVDRVNALLRDGGHPPLTAAQLTGHVNQLKAFIDVCHTHGIAVIADVVYNHAGGSFDEESLDFLTLPADPGEANSIYFSTGRLAGGKVFDYAEPDVREFLIGNARMFLEDYHVDGFRFDEVTVIDQNGGWYFCQELTGTLRHRKPSAVLIAEYWGEQRWRAVAPPVDNAGMGFDLGYADGLRDAVRGALEQAARGADAVVDMGRLRDGLLRPPGVADAWRVYNCIESHDLVLDGDGGGHRLARVPELAHPGDPRSWSACSRSRVATGLLLTAPGVPMLFMGQEILADRLWSDDPKRTELLVRWTDLDEDPEARDFHRFTRDLLGLRRRHPALRSDPVAGYHVDPANRVLAFQRWVPGAGRDVVVVVSLCERSFFDGGYALGLPSPGRWIEVFNSDYYDNFPNAWVQGNAGGVDADGGPLHGFGQSAPLTIPANSMLVLARDHGD